MPAAAPAGQLGLFDARDTPPEWAVRQSARARRLTVKVFPGGRVEVVVPRGTGPVAVAAFVSRHRDWIDRKISELRHVAVAPVEPLPREIEFQALGERWTVEYQAATSGTRVTATDGCLLVRGDLGRVRVLRHALQRWLMRHAHLRLGPWLAETALATSTQFRRVQVRRQRTRWGSCSRRGTISLNACLLFQPPAVTRYLFVHELAHTVHMNHSSRFWRQVADWEPDWRALDRELMRGWRHVPAWVLA